MNAQTRMSAKGQIVIPKDVRERYRFGEGDALDVIERPDGVLLRRQAPAASETAEALRAQIRRLIRYDGPPVSIEEMNESIRDGWIRSAEQSNCARD